MPEIQIPTEIFPLEGPPANPLQQLMGELKLSAQLPGEGIAIAIVNALVVARQTMSDPNKDKWDSLQIRIAEDTYTVWRNLWERTGVLPSTK
jgi:hypothetical protein